MGDWRPVGGEGDEPTFREEKVLGRTLDASHTVGVRGRRAGPRASLQTELGGEEKEGGGPRGGLVWIRQGGALRYRTSILAFLATVTIHQGGEKGGVMGR